MGNIAWVTGAGGLIGSHIVRCAPALAPDWEVRPITRERLDLCDSTAVERAFQSDRPNVIIHCAAISKSPVCQAQPELAWRVNFQTTKHLAELAAESRLLFFSTDLVFDGKAGNYDESASVNPLSVYAETKAAAEQVVLANPRHTVIRTSLNAGPSPTGDRGFDEQLATMWRKGQRTRLFTDEFRSPIGAAVTARAVWDVVRKDLRGLYHAAGAERLSRWDIGELLVSRWREFAGFIEPGSLKDYSGAPRSPDTSLNCAKVQQHLAFSLPYFSEWFKNNAF